VKIEQIFEVLPHRFPMLLVDRILEMDAGKSGIALKNVTINEAFFQGHYPGVPIMPGVLILESMAQAGAIVIMSEDLESGYIPLIGGMEDVRFRRQVVPGDQLLIEIEVLWRRGHVGKIKAIGRVEGEVAAEMLLTYTMRKGKRVGG
jgi:3-hydroxyacyl-[acyl-carrier-protein] dehydratase